MTTKSTNAVVIPFEGAVLDLQVHRLIQLDEQLKAAKDARDELADEIVESVEAAGGTVTIDGIKVTVVRAVRRIIDIVKLEEVVSRPLFNKLTKRVVSITDFDAHVQAGTRGIEAVEEIVELVESKPSLRITK